MTIDTDRVERALTARLEPEAGRPLAVAFSGGGDSLALLLIAKAWAARIGRPVIALTVDHRLQVQSGEWAAWCAARAAGLGVAHQSLVWDGPKPATGLASAARQARHRLIAEAARRAGARVVLFGHTADDILEARRMRKAGVGVSAPTEWSPSPVWPEGRGLFILRPLIGARRAAIRAWLSGRGETWIDDPANEDMRQPRARARADAADGVVEPVSVRQMDPPMADPSVIGPAGDISLPVAEWRDLPNRVLWLGAAVASAAGGQTPPRRAALERITARLAANERVVSTLGGARVVLDRGLLVIARETGDSRGRACRPLTLRAGEHQVWDGRFEVRANEPGLTLSALRGHAAKLDAGQRTRLSAIHPVARAALPALIDPAGVVACPTLAPDPRAEIRCLVPGRLAGAIGAIDSEARIGLYDREGEEGSWPRSTTATSCRT
ncbi:MAG TPA: tRNA lysidine(34) synthetase TilS [Caulobacteraceae bacterium]